MSLSDTWSIIGTRIHEAGPALLMNFLGMAGVIKSHAHLILRDFCVQVNYFNVDNLA
jgi:hypothetical protein